MPLHHVSITVADLARARDFYLAALKPLGYKLSVNFFDGKVLGFGPAFGGPDFWLSSTDVPSPDGSETRHKDMFGPDGKAKEGAQTHVDEPRQATGPMHLAFAAPNRAKVREFYHAAIAAGGKCNGPPGPRPEYFATYYGAFVLDPDGRNIEAVCLKPGFWAESWRILGWGTVGVVGGAAGGLLGRYMGWI